MTRPIPPLFNIPSAVPSATPLLSSAISSLSGIHPGQWMYERIAKSIIAFEAKLDPDKEIGARLVNFASGETISIDDVGYWGTDLIIFYGRNPDGFKVELLQHITQVNVLLVAVPVAGEPKRIGFLLEEKLKEKGDE